MTCTKGAVAAGGHTIGVTCLIFGRPAPNPYIRQEVPTFSLFARLETLIRLGHGYVVLPGGTGTLAELALVWELFNKGLLQRSAPIVLLGRFWMPAVELLLLDAPETMKLEIAESVEDAIRLLRGALPPA